MSFLSSMASSKECSAANSLRRHLFALWMFHEAMPISMQSPVKATERAIAKQ
jgi:hypothetical protein